MNLVRAIREQKALPITDEEAEGLARMLEPSRGDHECLANALSAARVAARRATRSAKALPREPGAD
jgi:hypothetical protein